MKSRAYQEKHFHFTVRKKLIKTKPKHMSIYTYTDTSRGRKRDTQRENRKSFKLYSRFRKLIIRWCTISIVT